MRDILNFLRGSAIQTTGNEEGTSLNLGPLALSKAVVNVTVVESGGTLALKIQGSDDDSTFYDLPGGVFLDPDDGATIDAVGRYEIFVKSDLQYIRCYGTVAGDDVTYECWLEKAHK